jgi:NAD(P)-dependent dehydrogenase (short-subunit alcohol dehydrogenase family)
MYATFGAIEAMRRRGGGAIVNVGSTSALGWGRKHSPAAAYDAAKAGVMRLTTALGWLKDEGIRVNCLVPDWVATAEVQAYVDALTPQQRKEGNVPDVLITLEEITDSVIRLATDESLAGRVMVHWCGQPPRLIAAGDPGYASLE